MTGGATSACSAPQINAVLISVLSNAIEAMPEGGRITISRACSDAEVCIEIADSGRGIPPEILPRIFDPFFTTKEAGRGSGLGLAVVYGLLRDMGGRVEVENAGGAVFTVTLPACGRDCQEDVP